MQIEVKFMSGKKFYLIILLFITVVSCLQQKPDNKKAGIIITSPEAAEIAALLVEQNEIIAVTSECDYPPFLQQKEKIGNFGNVDFEKISELNPALVITTGHEQKKLNHDLQKLGIKTVSLYPQSVTKLFSEIRRLGDVLKKPERAKVVIDSLKQQYEAVVAAKRGRARQPSLYIEIYGNPLMTVSDSSFVGNVIKLAGAENIFPELPRDYCRIKPEAVIERNPEVILLTYPGVEPQRIKNRKGWQQISACKYDRIYTVNDFNPALILRAGPRIFSGIKKLQKLLYED